MPASPANNRLIARLFSEDIGAAVLAFRRPPRRGGGTLEGAGSMKKREQKAAGRHPIGQISIDTKGPPGFHMEASGLWNKDGLSS